MKRAGTCIFMILALGGAAGCGPSQAAPRPLPPSNEAWLTAQQVDGLKLVIAPVAERDVDETVVASGRVAFDDLRVAHVFSPVSGRVVRIASEPGQAVARGAILAEIESPDIGNAFSDLAKARADVEAAERDYHRQRELFEAHAASQKDYETALNNFEKSKSEQARTHKKAQLLARGGRIDAVTQLYRLVAPIDGQVIMRAVSPGMEVVGQYAQGGALELFTIGDLGRVWVVADVFQRDLGRVRERAVVRVRVDAYRDRLFEGTVEWISGQLDASTRTARVRCAIDNRDGALKVEMYATVSIAVPGRKTFAIPRTALLRLGDQTVVFVERGLAANGVVRFERRPVAVDEDGGEDYLPIVGGLEPGERVASGAVGALAALM